MKDAEKARKVEAETRKEKEKGNHCGNMYSNHSLMNSFVSKEIRGITKRALQF
jgi:hypothetical protein